MGDWLEIEQAYDAQTYLGIARVCVKDIGEELAGTCHACYYEAMDVEAVDNKISRRRGIGGRRWRWLSFRSSPDRGPRFGFIVSEIRVGLVILAVPHLGVGLGCRSRGGACWLGLRLSAAFLGLHDHMIDTFSHSIKVDEQTQEYFVGSRTIFVNAAQIAHYRNGRDILAVEGQY